MVQDRLSEDGAPNPTIYGNNDSFNEPTFIPPAVFSSYYNEILEEHSLNQDNSGLQSESVNGTYQGYTHNGSDDNFNDFEIMGDSYYKSSEETLPTKSGQNYNQRLDNYATNEPLINFNSTPPLNFKNHLATDHNSDIRSENKFDLSESFNNPESIDQNHVNDLFSEISSQNNVSSDFLIQFCQHIPKGTCQKFTITKFFQHSIYQPWLCETHTDFYQNSEKNSYSETPVSSEKTEEPPFLNSKVPVSESKVEEPSNERSKPHPFLNKVEEQSNGSSKTHNYSSNVEEPPALNSIIEEDLPSTSLSSSNRGSAAPSPTPFFKEKESDSLSLFSMGNSSNSKWSTASAKTSSISTKPKARSSSRSSVKTNLSKSEFKKEINVPLTKTPVALSGELLSLSGIQSSVPKDIWDDRKPGLIYIYSVKTPVDAKVPIKQYYRIGSKMNTKSIYSEELGKCPIVNGIKGQGTKLQFSFLGGGIGVKHLKLCLHLLHEEVKRNLFCPAPLKNNNCPYCEGSHDEWFYLPENCISHLERNHNCPRDIPNFGWTYISSALRQIKTFTDKL